MTTWLALQLALLLLLFAHSWLDYARAPRLPRKAPPPQADRSEPTVDVLVPARNEEHNILACLESLLQQTGVHCNILVIDDRSHDRTALLVEELAQREARVALLRCPPPEPGWCGKSWALHCGVQRRLASSQREGGRNAERSFYCFVDADVHLSSNALTRALAYANEHGTHMLSLLPSLTTLTFWERVLQPVMAMLMFVAQPLRLINHPGSPLAVANGQFLLIDRDTYQTIGGHAAIRSEIVEDVALARAVKQHDLTLSLLIAPDAMRTRMYSNFQQIWRGWGKTIHPYLQREPGKIWLGVSFVCALMLLPFATLAPAAAASSAALTLNAIAVTLIVANAVVFRALSHQPLRHALLWPVGVLILVALFGSGTIAAWRGQQVAWKGRRYS